MSFACDGRRRARSLIEAKIIAIIGRVPGRPDALSCALLQRLHDRLLFAPMEQNDPPARHDRGAKTLAHVHLPQHFDPWFRPRCRQLAGINAVASRSQELGPILTVGGLARQ
jgi:hypothetical protein